MQEPELIKIDRNGSKHLRGAVECDRCSGRGVYATGVCNGELVLSHLDSGICWKCHGKGFVIETWIERTPEYQAKLDARREARQAKKAAEYEAQAARIRAEFAAEAAKRKAEEEREAEEKAKREAEKAISQFVGTVGEKLTVTVVYVGTPHFTRMGFGGCAETCYINTFKDEHGNKIVWKTGSRNVGVSIEEGATVTITGTVKEHSEYKGEKQTSIIRCKVSA